MWYILEIILNFCNSTGILKRNDLVKWILRTENEKQVYIIGFDSLDGYWGVRGVRTGWWIL